MQKRPFLASTPSQDRAATRESAKTVLVYVSNLLPWSETFIREQVMALRRWRGILVGIRELNQLALDDIEVRVLRPDRGGLLERAGWKLANRLGTFPRSAISSLVQERASLVHAHFGTEGVRAWPIARALNLPMLVTLHGYDISIKREWWEAGNGGASMRHYPSHLLQLAEHTRVHFIAVSDAVRQQAIRFGIPIEKITTHYIGVDVKRFSARGRPIAERQRRVLFVGRLVEKKGCDVLIRAFAKVRATVTDARLIIIGDGVLRNSLEDLARQLDLQVEFRGALPTGDVQRELELARVFCLPSVTAVNGDAEGLPMVLLEAQASAVPVVTSARGGAAEGMVEGATGFAFPERNGDLLAELLIELLTNDATITSMAAAGPRFVANNFNISRCTEMLEVLYDRMLTQE